MCEDDDDIDITDPKYILLRAQGVRGALITIKKTASNDPLIQSLAMLDWIIDGEPFNYEKYEWVREMRAKNN